jgi:uroporphyrinogen III methyltransferase/synthase
MVIYKTQLDDLPKEHIIKLFEKEEIDYITFTSSSTVSNFFSLVEPKILAQKPNLKLVCIGPVTAKTLEGYGFCNYIMAKEYTICGLVESILEHAKSINI